MSALKLIASLSLASLVVLSACGAHNPPQELVDARAAYAHAQQGNANQLAPADLHVARVSLDDAEHKFSDDPDAQSTRDVAYIAMRKAQRAEAVGNTAAAESARAAYNAQHTKTQEEIIASQRNQLHAAQGEIVQQQAATEAERAARIEAEKRAKDSMDALSRQMTVKPDERGTVITLSGNVLFSTGKSTILAGAQDQLDKVADTLKTQAEHHFNVEGHTDNQGTDTINAELSQRRANAVRDYLIARGVSADVISAQGLGSTRPVADNKTAEGRAMNRRVEIVVDRGAATTSPQASAAK